MQPDEVKQPEPKQPDAELIPENPTAIKKKKPQWGMAILFGTLVTFMVFALMPQSNGHGASHSSRSRSEQRQAEITRTMSSENNQADDPSSNQR